MFRVVIDPGSPPSFSNPVTFRFLTARGLVLDFFHKGLVFDAGDICRNLIRMPWMFPFNETPP
jgi:hypothetical protein